MKNTIIVVGVTAIMLWIFGSLMDQAMADNDVTSSGSTTNDQVNSTGSNTAITGGYNSETENTTNYQSGSSSTTSTTSTSNNVGGDGVTIVTDHDADYDYKREDAGGGVFRYFTREKGKRFFEVFEGQEGYNSIKGVFGD